MLCCVARLVRLVRGLDGARLVRARWVRAVEVGVKVGVKVRVKVGVKVGVGAGEGRGGVPS